MIGIIGTGGHSKVISDIFRRTTPEKKLIYFTVFLPKEAIWIEEEIYIEEPEIILKYQSILGGWHVAIGNPTIRKKKFEFIEENTGKLVKAIHDKSILASSTSIGDGTSVMAGVVINPNTKIGKGSIINTSASIDHDCIIGDFVNIGPGSRLAGGVTIGDQTELGTGVSVIPNITIGKNCTIGAGAVVIQDIPDNSIAVGVPAKIISFKNQR